MSRERLHYADMDRGMQLYTLQLSLDIVLWRQWFTKNHLALGHEFYLTQLPADEFVGWAIEKYFDVMTRVPA